MDTSKDELYFKSSLQQPELQRENSQNQKQEFTPILSKVQFGTISTISETPLSSQVDRLGDGEEKQDNRIKPDIGKPLISSTPKQGTLTSPTTESETPLQSCCLPLNQIQIQ